MERIFIVEDEEKMRDELSEILAKNGYECLIAENFEHVTEEILSQSPDLVLLDLNLPVHDGFYTCKELRKRSEIPVIVVTSKDSDLDELMSLNSGADDFITKPYNVHILLAHIASVLHRTYGRKDSIILNHNGLSLDVLKGKALYQGQEIDLTKNELGILKALMENPGVIVSRNDLICRLWEMEEFVEDGTLTVNINRLRKKLADLGLDNFLRTKRGQGYLV